MLKHTYISDSARLTHLSLYTIYILFKFKVMMSKERKAKSDKITQRSSPCRKEQQGERHGKPLQYSCLENPMDRGAWWATAHRVAKSRTQLK